MTRYEHSFLTKCAEYGVPPQTAYRLMKTAKSRLGHEIAGSLVNPLNLFGGNAIGSFFGELNGSDLSDEEIARLIEERGNLANYFLPGASAYRLSQRPGSLARKIVERAKELHIEKVRPKRHMFTEALSAINPLNIIGTPVGTIVGIAGKHRTLDEQVEHDSKSQSWKNLLLPGYAAYHNAKRLGATRDIMERDKESKDDDKSEKTAAFRSYLRKRAEGETPASASVATKALEAASTSPAPVVPSLSPEVVDRLPRYGAAVGAGISVPSLLMALGGAGIGALIDRKKRLRGALIGALLGIPVGGAGLGALGGYNARKQINAARAALNASEGTPPQQ